MEGKNGAIVHQSTVGSLKGVGGEKKKTPGRGRLSVRTSR